MIISLFMIQKGPCMKEIKGLHLLGAAIVLISSISNVFPLSNNPDIDFTFSGAFKPETFYGKNINLLNNLNASDKIWYARHTLDLNFDLVYGKKTYEQEVGHMYFTIRNKAVWGNPNSISATTAQPIKDVNSVIGSHKHYIPRHIFWIRELWFEFNVSPALGLSFDNKHTFKIGAFSFELGKGIALGDAYAVGPGLLGFYTEFDVDQYAFGAKLSGPFVPEVLTYDLYVAILQNKASSFSDTAEWIYGRAFGRLDCPERGFGQINFLVAARTQWTVFDNERLGSLVIEPYGLYNNDPEQRVQFLADATSKLGTVGLNAEYEGERFALGFDFAQNFGQQQVMGWDRNDIVHGSVFGSLSEITPTKPTAANTFISGIVEQNSQVFFNSPSSKLNVPYVKDSATQKIIDESRDDEILGDGSKKEQQNGQFIGIDPVTGLQMFNGKVRFRNAYNNTYHGWMFVTDGSVWAFGKDLQFSAAAGVASGDENPNFVTKDGTYDGFTGIQEMYSGKRVKSVFLMGGSGKLRRPLAAPTVEQAPSKFASVISGFTNIVFTGVSCNWKPEEAKKKFNVHPNVIAFWQQKPTKAFDLATLKDADYNARTYLGTESNVFFNYNILKDLRFFVVASAFFPGSFYVDIHGKPLDELQQAILARRNNAGDATDMVPNIGTDIAYTFNVGLDYKF